MSILNSRPKLLLPRRTLLRATSNLTGSRPVNLDASETLTLSQKMKALYRTDLFAFAWRAFAELYPGTTFKPNWHLRVIAAKLQCVAEGKIKRLIICLPPRSLKSFLASVAFPAWVLGHMATRELMCISYGQELAEKLSRDTLRLMQSQFYREVFETRISSDRHAADEFMTSAGGVRLARSITGGTTGRGGHISIIDDAHKASDAFSETKLALVRDCYDNSVQSRLNDKVTGATVIIGQRIHDNDLIGHVLTQGDWEVVSFPAIATADEEHYIETPYGPRVYRRAAGEALHPDREPLAVLERLRSSMGEATFQPQYQQDPTPVLGNWVSPDMFPRYTPATLPARFDEIVLSIDSANKVSEGAAFTVGTVWGICGNTYYLLHVLRQRVEFNDLLNVVMGVATRFRVTHILVEDQASGTPLIQELRRVGGWSVTECRPDASKRERFAGVTPIIRRGSVVLPAEAPWLAEYVRELCSFPTSKFSDQVDSTSQFLIWTAKPRSSAYNIIGYYQGLIEKKQTQSVPTNEHLAAAGYSHIDAMMIKAKMGLL